METTDLVVTADENEDAPDDEATIDEEFRGLYSDIGKIKDRWLVTAKKKEAEGDTVSAQILRMVAGDIIPIITDLIATSGGAFDEMSAFMEEQTDAAEGSSLTEEEAVQVYVTLMSNIQAFTRLKESASETSAKEAFDTLIALNTTTMTMLRDNFGDEIAEAAAEQVKEAEETE